jgi:uncharacterized membrane protein
MLPWVGLALLGLPGTAVAAYLTYAHWADRPTVCGGIGQCELVQTSEYSEIAGVPVALLGLLYFVAMSFLALARLGRMLGTPEWAQPAALSMALAATAFAAYLAYVELFVLEEICIWCSGLAALTAASLALIVWGLSSGREG